MSTPVVLMNNASTDFFMSSSFCGSGYPRSKVMRLDPAFFYSSTCEHSRRRGSGQAPVLNRIDPSARKPVRSVTSKARARGRLEPDRNGRNQTKIGNMASQTKLRCDVEQRSFPKNGCKTDINTAQNPV